MPQGSSLQYMEFNKPEWPNRYARDISRFEKENIFGVPTTTHSGLPGSDSDRELYLNFLKKLNSISGKLVWDDFLQLIRVAAWTYHPNELSSLQDYERRKLKTMMVYKNNFTIQAAEASYYANMFQTRDDAMLFMKVFFCKLMEDSNDDGSVKNANNWYRAAYQVLMANPSVADSLSEVLPYVYRCLYHLIASYFANLRSNQIKQNICRVLVFLLKVRRSYNEFCRPDEDDEVTVNGCYYLLLNLLSSGKKEDLVAVMERRSILLVDYWEPEFRQVINLYDTVLHFLERPAKIAVSPWGDILNRYLNGKGNLDIPIADMDKDM